MLQSTSQASGNLLLQPQKRNLLGHKWVRKLRHTTLKLLLLFHFSKQLLQTCFSLLCRLAPRPWQIKFLVIKVYVLVFYSICSLRHFHIKIFARVKQKLIAFLVNTQHNLDDFASNAIADLFVYERLKIPEGSLDPIRTSKMELL